MILFLALPEFMKLCVPLKISSIEALINELKKSQKTADLVEIWFDELVGLDEENMAKIDQNCAIPILYKVSKVDIKHLFLILNKIKKIQYLDLDIGAKNSIINKLKIDFPKLKIIISKHDFKSTPPQKELLRLASKMINKGADIIKIATTAKNTEDSINMLSILSKLSSQGYQAICICMGKKGHLTRIAGHLFGNYLMYAPLDGAGKTASGQLEIADLKKIINLQE